MFMSGNVGSVISESLYVENLKYISKLFTNFIFIFLLKHPFVILST
jgi:hypothetical protein